MVNVVISSTHLDAKKVSSFLLSSCKEVFSTDASSLRDGDYLFIVAHDFELGSGEKFCEYYKNIFNKINHIDYKIALIVCYAKSHHQDKQGSLLTPAEHLANFTGKTVLAAPGPVIAEFKTNFFNQTKRLTFTGVGGFHEIKPQSDLSSLFERLKI